VGLMLDITAGPLVGKKIEIAAESDLIIGRSDGRAQFVVPDNFMSGAHFSVVFGRRGCRIRDLKSANGTFLNGVRIDEALIVNGDEIRTGKTAFLVRIVRDKDSSSSAGMGGVASYSPLPPPTEVRRSVKPSPDQTPHRTDPNPADEPMILRERHPELLPVDPVQHPSFHHARPLESPPPPVARVQPPATAPRQPVSSVVPSHVGALNIGPWEFTYVPEGWEPIPEFGLQLVAESRFPSNIVASEERLGAGVTLQQYVQAQTKMLRQYLKDPTIDAATAQKIKGATETIVLEVRYATKDGGALYFQRIYAKNSEAAGVLAMTTLEDDLPKVLPVFQIILGGVSFSSSK
jgi:predicted component of type VI protein secretion system